MVLTAGHTETDVLDYDTVFLQVTTVLQEHAASIFRVEGGTYKSAPWHSIYLHNYTDKWCKGRGNKYIYQKHEQQSEVMVLMFIHRTLHRNSGGREYNTIKIKFVTLQLFGILTLLNLPKYLRRSKLKAKTVKT